MRSTAEQATGRRSSTGRPYRRVRVHRGPTTRVDLEVQVRGAPRVPSVADTPDLVARAHAAGTADVRLEVGIEVGVPVAPVQPDLVPAETARAVRDRPA